MDILAKLRELLAGAEEATEAPAAVEEAVEDAPEGDADAVEEVAEEAAADGEVDAVEEVAIEAAAVDNTADLEAQITELTAANEALRAQLESFVSPGGDYDTMFENTDDSDLDAIDELASRY